MDRFLAALALATALAPLATAQEAAWTPLFDGRTLDGWQAGERPESWKVEDGAMVTRGDRSHLFYVGPVGGHDFKNFELRAEVMTEPFANSGIYVHTKLQGPGWPEAGYELQVVNSTRPGPGYQERKMTGSVYAVRNTWVTSVRDDQWFSYRIRVVGRTIQDLHQRRPGLRVHGAGQRLAREGQAGPPSRLGYLRPPGPRSGQRGPLPEAGGADPAGRSAHPRPRPRGRPTR
jgi:hypothetical protein